MRANQLDKESISECSFLQNQYVATKQGNYCISEWPLYRGSNTGQGNY